MSNRAEDILQRIAEARRRIQELFRDQCKHGRQTTALAAKEAAACGQFLQVRDRPQRGLHGTAAAIRVLADDTDSDSVDLVKRMVHYLRNRDTCEPQSAAKCLRDNGNVIKISETIAALTSVPQTTTATSDIADKLASALRSNMKEDRGWSYFLDDTDEPEALPTAYACYALSKLGVDQAFQKSKHYLLNHLKKRYTHSTDARDRDVDTMTDVFCLYVLALSDAGAETPSDRKVLAAIFDRVWRRLETLLNQDLEQNIEYWHQEETCYVRVPWQLYLLSLAAHYRFRGKFSSLVAQRQLMHILDKLNREGFLYPHSGKFLSARTYAILYEVLGKVQSHLNRENLFALLRVWDYTRSILCSRVAHWLVRMVLIGLIAYVCYRAYPIKDRSDFAGLVGNLIAPLILAGISWAKRNR